MLRNKYFLLFIFLLLMIWGCSTKRNTKTTRMYHELNTRYNVYFNADEAYKEALKSKQSSHQDNMSRLLDAIPVEESAKEKQQTGGSFDVTVDKTTKAIKLHSITSKPERDPGKRQSKEYKEWLKQREFNPFLKNAWLLLGKAEYQNNDFLQASSTFSYITRIYSTDKDVVLEARLWLVRCYLGMDWLYEAEDVLHKIDLSGGATQTFDGEYSELYADLLLRKKEYSQAVPYLEKAAEKADSSWQKLRLRYLLGQTYAHLGEKEKAYAAFDKVPGINTPYMYTFNAKIQQAALASGANKKQVLSDLEKMARNTKNKEYLDQVYYAIGNIFLNDQDTTKAIDAYKKAIKESTRNGYDKAIAQIVLGDIYFNQRDYTNAQPNYSEALNGIDKKHEDYTKVELRSSVLEELVKYSEAIHLQDSLQHLAQMPEQERISVIEKTIKELKKKEEEERKQAERENREYNPNVENPLFDQKTPQMPTPQITGIDADKFYFYNPQLVTQGKTAFQRKWGSRKLEDDWRRRNKKSSVLSNAFDSFANNDTPSDTLSTDTNNKAEQAQNKTDDIYSVQYYLNQLPFTPQAIEASNEIIEDAYFNMGKIYKDQLEDYPLAIESFETDIKRFPNTPNLEEIYYQLFLIYLRLGNKEMTEVYRRNILNSFPKGDYAATLSNPDYEWNLKNIYHIQDDLYQKTYEAYLAGNTKLVRNNYKSIKENYPLSDLMPKFMYLNALTYAQTNNPLEFKELLTELIEKYPKADVSVVASETLKGLLSGRNLASDSSPARGMIWDMKFGSLEQIEEAAGVDFVAQDDAQYLLLFLYKSNTVNKNQLIYDVANYNFSNFIYKTFDLNFTEVNTLEILQLKGFTSFKEVNDYIDLSFEKGSLMDELPPSIITVPISEDNYIALMNGKSLNEYFLFFEKNYTKEMIRLIMYWNEQRKREMESDGLSPLPVEQEKPSEEIIIEEEIIEVEPRPIEKEVRQTTPPVRENEPKRNEGEIGVGDILSDDVIEKADDIINKATDIFNNPVDGLKGLFNSGKSSIKKTKEEKEAEKEEKRIAKKQEKERQAEERARIKAKEDAEQARQDSIDKAKQEKEDEEKALRKARELEAKRKEQERKDAVKQRERELKEREKARKEKLKQAERERNARLKQREQERKEKERIAKENQKNRD